MTAVASPPVPVPDAAAEAPRPGWWRRIGLVGRFVLVSLLVTVAVGLLVAQVTAAELHATALDEEAERVATVVSGRLGGLLRPVDLSAPIPEARYAEIDRAVRLGTSNTSTLAVNLWRPDRTVAYSTDRATVGRAAAGDEELGEALDGAMSKEIKPAAEVDTALHGTGIERVMEIYVPLRAGGRVMGAFELYRDLRDVENRVAAVERATVLALAGGLAVLFTALLLVVRGAARQLRRQSDELARLEAREEVDRLRAEFVATVSHELRTPLTALVGFSELLLDPGVAPGDRQEWTGLLHSGAQRLRHLVEQLLDVSRLDEGRLELRLGPVDVPAAVAEALESFAALPARYRMEQDFPPDLPPVHADRDKLVQIVTNLVSNAVKYSPDGGTIRIGARHSDGQVALRVTDHGLGLPPGQRDRIFQRFHRVDDERRRTIEGTGLGLYITRRLAELHGGTITAHSLGPRRGSTFTVTLPAARRG